MKLLWITFFVSAVASNANARAHKAGQNAKKNVPIQSRIVGGTAASQGEFPFFVLFGSGGCGASLIHEDIVLSAAHCNDVSERKVLVGAFKYKSTQGGAVYRKITARRVHPRYGDSSTYNFDYLVMRLNEPVTNITPVALNSNSTNPTVNESLTVIGFGILGEDNYVQPNKLRKVNVTYVDPNKCSRKYGQAINPKIELCAGSAGKDSCKGDSGGPILDSDGVQVGITSWGFGCGRPRYPGIYSRISGAIDWINKQVCDLSANPPSSCKGGNSTQLTPSPSTYPMGVSSNSPSIVPSSPSLGTPRPTATSSPTPSFNDGKYTYAPTSTLAPAPSFFGGETPSSDTFNPTPSRSPAFGTYTYSPTASTQPHYTYSPTASTQPHYTYSPTASSQPQYTYSPTASTQPHYTYSPTASTQPHYTYSPTASTRPHYTDSPTASRSPFFGPTRYTYSPAPTPTVVSGGAFSVANLRVACETFPCPYNHQNVQYCHVESNKKQKSYCVSADIAFIFMADNSRDYCGPCVKIEASQ